MSFFGKGFGAAFAQTLEAVGNIVAPLPEDDDLDISNNSADYVTKGHLNPDGKTHNTSSHQENEDEEDRDVFNHGYSENQSFISSQPIYPQDAIDSPLSHLSEVDLNDEINHSTFESVQEEPKPSSIPIMSAISNSLGYHGNNITTSASNLFQNYNENISAALFFSSSSSHETKQPEDDVNEEFDRLTMLQQRVKDYAIKYETLMNEKLELSSENKVLKQRLEQQEVLLQSVQQLKTELSFERSNNIQMNNVNAQMKYKFQNQISELESELALLKSTPPVDVGQFRVLTETNAALENEISVLQAEKVSSTEKIRHLEEELIERANQLSKLFDERSSSSRSIENMTDEAKHHKDLYEALLVEFNKQTAELNRLHESLSLQSLKGDDELLLLRQKINDLNHSYADSLNEKDQVIAKLTAQISSLTSHVDTLQSELVSNQRAIESSSDQVIALTNEISVLKENLNDSGDRLHQTQTDFDALEENLRKSIDRESHQELIIKQLETQLDESQHLLLFLQSSSSNGEANYRTLESQYRELIGKCSDLESDLLTTQQQLMSATSERVELNKALQDLSTKLNQMEIKLYQERAESESLCHEYKACLNDLATLRQDINSKDEVIAQLHAKIQELSNFVESQEKLINKGNNGSSSDTDKDATIIGLLSQIQLLESRLIQKPLSPHSTDSSVTKLSDDLRSLINEIYAWIGEELPIVSSEGNHDLRSILRISMQTINDLKSLVIQANEELEAQLQLVENLQSKCSELTESSEKRHQEYTSNLQATQHQLEIKDATIGQHQERILSLQREVEILNEKLTKLGKDFESREQQPPTHVHTEHIPKSSSVDEVISLRNELNQERDNMNSLRAKLAK